MVTDEPRQTDPSTETSDRGSRHDPDTAIQTARRARVVRAPKDTRPIQSPCYQVVFQTATASEAYASRQAHVLSFHNRAPGIVFLCLSDTYPSLIQSNRPASARKLLLHALGSEPHLLWLDADVQFLSPGRIQLMLAHSVSDPRAEIITARCQEGPTYNYDKNAWAGMRSRGSGPGMQSIDPAIAAEEAQTKQRFVDKLIEGMGDGEVVGLDAVGGTILYMRAGLVWEGLNFPS